MLKTKYKLIGLFFSVLLALLDENKKNRIKKLQEIYKFIYRGHTLYVKVVL